MKRIRIIHKTEYRYNEPVSFGPHRVMMRPREGHDVHIVRGRLDVTFTAIPSLFSRFHKHQTN